MESKHRPRYIISERTWENDNEEELRVIFNLLSEDIRDYLDPKHYEEKL